MNGFRMNRADRVGLARPAIEAHTLGISSVEQLLRDCGYQTVVAEGPVCEALQRTDDPAAAEQIERWLRNERITVLGFSYRLDPARGAELFGGLVRALRARRLMHDQGGPLRGIFFAGLPAACDMVLRSVSGVTGVFRGSETPAETLAMLGIDPSSAPAALTEGMAYDEARLAFGRDLIRKGDHLALPPPTRGGYAEFGTRSDTLAARLDDAAARGTLPLVRAHVGPYLPDRSAAVAMFLDWTRRLAQGGLLDVLSIGTSQLAQSDFGSDWQGRPDGGGVPLNSAEEYAAVWRAARPMLVRCYAGTRNIPAMARMYEQTINMAWHALSLWWFCRLDGRGPYGVLENLRQHVETLRYIGSINKPFEPNVPHHFAFRGADDTTFVVSACLAAKAALRAGVRHLVLQVMLNTPRATWGIQDLAKARACLALVRPLETEGMRITFQPRGGLDYFSPDPDTARAQLAAVTALMDDVEPHDESSPPVVHVVSFSEALHLADPPVIEESIRITRHALAEYRRLRRRGLVDDMSAHAGVRDRTAALMDEARSVIQTIETDIADPYTPEGLYRVLAGGYLPVPHLMHCRDEFPLATCWQTRMVDGGVRVVDAAGLPMRAAQRMEALRAMRSGGVAC